MVANAGKKTFTFSSENKKMMVENILADQSISGQSPSLVLENLILNEYLPKDPTFRGLFERLYSEESSIQEVVKRIWNHICGTTDLLPSNLGHRALVKFAILNLNKQCTPMRWGHEEVYFKNTVNLIINGLIDYLISCPSFFNRDNELLILKTLQDSLNDADLYLTNFEYFNNLYTLILEHWDYMIQNMFTSRLLACMARIQDWEDTPASRMELIDICNQISDSPTRRLSISIDPIIIEAAEEDKYILNNESLLNKLDTELFGKEEALSSYIKLMYKGSLPVQRTLMNLLEIISYTPAYMRKANIVLIKIIQELIGDSCWYEPCPNNTDFKLDEREYKIGDLFKIYEVLNREITHRINSTSTGLLKDLQPWELNVLSPNLSHILKNPETYSSESIEHFLDLEKQMSVIPTPYLSLTPSQVLDLIKEHWSIIYKTGYTYELIEYCLFFSSTLYNPSGHMKSIRLFIRNFDPEN